MSTSNRLPGIDGLRAIAALWVVLFHISAFSGAGFPQVPGADLLLKSGSTGVSLFLVLSGFCLYLPFAAGRLGRFKTMEFLWRRCRRLMPAYYASLALSLVFMYALAGPLGLPQLGISELAWQLVTHLTLLHSLFPDTFYQLNGAYWSLGLEWQLYLAMPLLIIGIRRFGLYRTLGFAVACNVMYRLALAAAIAGGLVSETDPWGLYVLPNQIFGRWAEFAFGMLAAELHATKRLQSLTRFAPAMLVAIALLVPLSLVSSHLDLSHIVYGALFFTLVCVVLMPGNVVTRALAWRPLVAIGTMSYSLYLVHQPIIQTVARWLEVYQPSLSPTAVFFVMLMLVPGMLLVAWVLFLTVERRTLGASGAGALVPRLRFFRGLGTPALLPRPAEATEH